jgi:hypothetical protein
VSSASNCRQITATPAPASSKGRTTSIPPKLASRETRPKATTASTARPSNCLRLGRWPTMPASGAPSVVLATGMVSQSSA